PGHANLEAGCSERVSPQPERAACDRRGRIARTLHPKERPHSAPGQTVPSGREREQAALGAPVHLSACPEKAEPKTRVHARPLLDYSVRTPMSRACEKQAP